MPHPPDAIETERLTLRGHQLQDLDECAAMWRSPDVVRYIGGKPSTEQEVWMRLLRYVGHWTLLGYGYWVVRERASDRLVGEVGFADQRRGLGPGFDGTPEIGWVLAPWAHGRGFATEAVRAALAWSEARLGSTRTVCLIDPGNLASLRVAAKSGYREFARTTYLGDPTILLERTRP